MNLSAVHLVRLLTAGILFSASAQAEGRFVAMPSKVVDALWHEFILHHLSARQNVNGLLSAR